MLLIEFQPAGDVALRTYSPISDQTYTNLESRGELDLISFMPDPDDLDRDKIPDAVEKDWGLDCDPDDMTPGGHYTYLQSYILDYTPDSTDFFKADISQSGTQIHLQFPSTNSRLYTVEYKESLTNSAGWSTLLSQTGSNGITRVDYPAGTQGFYRVKVQIPEE